MRTRWPRKPPKGVRCDANVPTPKDWVKPDSFDLSLHIFRCEKQATETLIWGKFENGMEVWLCDEHADHFVTKDIYLRNPKR